MVFGACGGGASLKMLLYEILVHCAFLGVRFVSLSVLLPTSFFLFFFFFFSQPKPYSSLKRDTLGSWEGAGGFHCFACIQGESGGTAELWAVGTPTNLISVLFAKITLAK